MSILESKRYEQNDIRVPEHTNCGHSGKHTNSGRRARIRVDAQYARRRRHKTYERIERAREDEHIPLNRKARETLAWVLANRVMHDEDEL